MKTSQAINIFGKHQKVWITWIAFLWAALLATTSVSSKDDANGIFAIDWNSDASRLAIERFDGTLEIIDVSTNVQLISLGPLDLGIISVVWSPTDPDKIAIAGGLGFVTLLDLSSTQPTAIFTDVVNRIDAIAWSSDGSKLIGAVAESSPPDQLTIHEWNPVTGVLTSKFQIYDEVLHKIAYSPDNTLVAAGSVDGKIIIWDATTHQPTVELDAAYRFDEGYSFVDALSRNPDSNQLVTANRHSDPPQSDLGFGDIESGELLANFPLGLIRAVEWNPTGTQVAFTQGNQIHIIEAVTGNLISTLQSSAKLNDVSWSPDGTKLAYGGRDGVISIISIPQFPENTPTLTQPIKVSQ